jgi:hypothetical protein
MSQDFGHEGGQGHYFFRGSGASGHAKEFSRMFGKSKEGTFLFLRFIKETYSLLKAKPIETLIKADFLSKNFQQNSKAFEQ